MGHLNDDPDARMSATPGTFKLDEGFAEDSQPSSGEIQNLFVAWLNGQPEQTKAEIAYEILRTLRSTDIAAVVERLNPLLHMDPIEKLPPEITQQVFSYLDASTLLSASLSSATWRERILDPRLWQKLYHSQGWGIDLREVKAFEEAQTDLVRSDFRKAKQEFRRSSTHNGQPLFKRRATSKWLQSTPRRVSADVAGWREQHSVIEADPDPNADGGDELMTDVPSQSPQRPNKRQSQDSGDEMDMAPDSGNAPDDSNLLLFEESGQARLNWPYVYKQRQRLEHNWLKGRYYNFQLPHPDHPNEAHTECVYTIQFYGKWLVSGSRDKSLRIWDLDTHRLRGKPLIGHSQSVLCLQFDPTPEEDIIISGSSDSSLVIWKFSTGQRLQTIHSAHEESVLNLRFDYRYLVTCSKDKKIKVWNRKALLPMDHDYPRAKSIKHCKVSKELYTFDPTIADISMLETDIANGIIKALPAYTAFMTLEGHNAAVNAIQIHGDKIVSASGDRMIRIWDVRTGENTTSISGHQKGIACVQYDGRRVVSGSSDNTVRIFEPISGTEVAVLLGHTNLVRTVQAGFGDTPGSQAEEYAAARAAEDQYTAGVRSGRLVQDRRLTRRVCHGEEGTSRLAFGSHLPPGGGGSKWARIVSGSYDESIIIWKKNHEGDWVVGQTLKQGDDRQSSGPDANLAPSRRRRRLRQDNGVEQQAPAASVTTSNAANQPTVNDVATLGSGNVMSAAQVMQQAMNTSIASLQTSVTNVTNLGRMLSGGSSSSGTVSRSAITNAMSQITAQAQAVTNNAINHALINGHANINTSITTSIPITFAQSAQTPQLAAATPTAQTLPQPQTPAQAAPRPPPRQTQNQNPRTQNQGGSVGRVFKLQFDARRIVCCSQDSRIIGWDFANGDPEIEECSRFFLGP